MARHPSQLAYQRAELHWSALLAQHAARSKPLDQAVDAGEISEDEWLDQLDQLDAELGMTEARLALEHARGNLLRWAWEEIRALWAELGPLFPGETLESLERLLERPEGWPRLLPILLRLERR